MNLQKVYIEAIALVQAGWTQGVNARDANGRGCYFKDPNACCFCTIGAVKRAVFNQTGSQLSLGENPVPALQVLHHILEGPISGWNDAEGRTREEVIALLKRAAEVAN